MEGKKTSSKRPVSTFFTTFLVTMLIVTFGLYPMSGIISFFLSIPIAFIAGAIASLTSYLGALRSRIDDLEQRIAHLEDATPAQDRPAQDAQPETPPLDPQL